MMALTSGVSCGGNDYDSVAHRFLGRLVDSAFISWNILVSAQRNIQHANVVTLAISNNPVNTSRDVFLAYATTFTYFHQHEFAFVRQSLIKTVTEGSVAGCGNRCLCPVPLPRLYRFIRSQRETLSSYVVISDDATDRCHKIRMWIKPGVHNGDCYTFAGIVRICM